MLLKFVKTISQCMTIAQRCIQQFRKQNLHAGLKEMQQLSTEMMELLSDINADAALLEEHACMVDIQYVTVMLSGVMEAQENRDYVLLADLLEMQMIPFLFNFQECLLNNTDMVSGELYEENMAKLKQVDRLLYECLKEYSLKGTCVIEPTSAGYLTMRMEDMSGSYYMHSNINPVLEGDIFAKQYYSEKYSNYIVYGLGLGYHVQALCRLDDGIYIDIIEPDLEVIKTAFTYMDMSWLINNERLNLILDEDYRALRIRLRDESSLLIHYPSLRHIEDPAVKLSLEKYFIHDSGIRNMLIQMINNFRDNIVNCNHYVDELQERFENKNVVIVAAGPSLDKNVELLRKLPENTIILAVGTVFKKLITVGIRPDFIIFLDAQAVTGRQIEGLENEQVPIMCSSTAYKKIAAQYKGEKYLICQEGYGRAEEYAAKNGYRVYETGGSVSTIALSVCLEMGCKSVAFIGLDLAFTDDRSHADLMSDYMTDYSVDESEGVELVPAIGGGMVRVSRIFVIYREWIEQKVMHAGHKTVVINATEGGALIRGLKNMTFQEVIDDWSKA